MTYAVTSLGLDFELNKITWDFSYFAELRRDISCWDNPNGRSLSGRVLSSGKAPGLKVIQRPYSCDVGEKSFTQSGNLHRHQTVH